MRSKISTRILAVLLSMSVTVPMMQTAYLSVCAESSASAWVVDYNSVGGGLPSKVQTAFDKAMESYNGMPLIPLACYGDQVVAGSNYYLICRENTGGNVSECKLKKVVVYNKLDGTAEISSVTDFNIEDYAKNHSYYIPDYPEPGSAAVPSELPRCELPSEAAAPFNKIFQGICGSECIPLAYLGKQTTADGTDYALLCRTNVVVPDPDIYIDVIIIHENTDGTAYEKSSYSLIGSKTSYPVYDDYNGISYKFDVNQCGYAQGVISFTTESEGTYKLYWADDNSALAGYYPIAELKMKTGVVKNVVMGYHTVIPAKATKIIATKGSLNVKDAYSVYNIPYYRRLSSMSGDLLYTFSTFSDIHIDRGNLWYVNADANLKQGLSYSTKMGSDYVVVSGDCVGNDKGPDAEWDAYQKILSKSDFVNPIWESDGNHDLRQGVSSGLNSFVQATGTDGSKSGKPYFYTIESNTGDIFIFMALELNKDPNKYDEFTDEQINWVTDLLERYYADRNIFIVQHAPVNGFGAGDRMDNPYYGGLMSQSNESTKKFVNLLKKYPDVVFMSGHTHEDFAMDYNYSDENGTAANMIHTPALAGSKMPNSTDDGLDANGGKGFNAQAYYVEVYENNIVFNGVNITDELIYPTYSYVMEGSRTSESPRYCIDGTIAPKNIDVPVADELDKVSSILSTYYKYASYDSYQALKKMYYQYKGKTMVDESIIDQFESKIEWLSTYTGGITYHTLSDRYYFVNNKDWSSVYAYAWNSSSDKNAAWPGVKLDKVGTDESTGKDIYCVKFDSKGQYKNLIFNIGSNSKQTVDISLEEYGYNSFNISGSKDSKYTVSNFQLNNVEDKRYVLLYNVSGEHSWTDMDKYMTLDKNGKFKTVYDASTSNSFSFCIYDKVTGKYYALSQGADFAFENNKTYSVSLEKRSDKGSAVTFSGLGQNKHLNIEFDADTQTVTILCDGIEEQPQLPLANNSTLSVDEVKPGSQVNLTGAATGGTAPYKFAYYYKKPGSSTWTKILTENDSAYVDSTSAAFTLTDAGIYSVRINVKDSAGTIISKDFAMTVKGSEEPLKNNSTISAATVAPDTTVNLTGAATGGTEPYKFAYYYKKSTESTYTKAYVTASGSAYTKKTSVSFKPASTGTYNVRINVKDGAADVVTKDFTITVKSDGSLKNNSKISAANVSVNTAITLTGIAGGGTDPYRYAYYYKLSSDSSWKKIVTGTSSTYVSASSTTFKPTAAGTYDIRINVKDSTNNIVMKNFTVTVTAGNSLKNNSSVSSASVSVNTEVTLTGKASGGTSPYKYAYYYKKSTESSWTKAYVTSSGSAYTKYDTMAFTPTSAGTYNVRINVKDNNGTGTAVSKDFTLTVK